MPAAASRQATAAPDAPAPITSTSVRSSWAIVRRLYGTSEAAVSSSLTFQSRTATAWS